MNTIIGTILVLGVIILVHEWGHFIVARLFGVRVDVFSIGFGPRLFGVKRGATDWRVSALPLGGYVRMAGQDITDIDSGDQKPTGAPDELLSKKRWQRALISFAGPAINLIFPVLLLGVYFVIAGEPYFAYTDKPLVVVGLPADGSNAPNASSGLRVGDRVVSINGVKNPTWGDASNTVSALPAGSVVKIQVENNGVTRQVDLTYKKSPDEHLFGYAPVPPKVLQVLQGGPASVGGMKDGDLIQSVNGSKVGFWHQFVDIIHRSEGKPVQIEVSRNGQSVSLSVTPKIGAAKNGDKVYQIGISPDIDLAHKPLGLAGSFAASFAQTSSLVVETIDVVSKLVTGRVSVKDLQSVIGISRAAGEAVSLGPSATILFMALISVNLGILNLLPIPILDGGHILLLSMEGIRRRDFSLAFKERFVQVGLVFLLVLIAYVMYNDVVRMFPLHS
ncbi:MAG TPA: RIP metalloprotease RseP [Candidatus Limnocylindrales bacterium]|nr:RIP metalloprotease RseP [Candidatus Limnocylindrales bacterium]